MYQKHKHPNPIHRMKAQHEAMDLVEKKPIFIDTETTGFANNSEIVEISIVDHDGKALFDSLVKPIGVIPPDAFQVHGISTAMTAGALTWQEIWPKVDQILSGRIVGFYNEEFDVRMMQQSGQQYGMAWNPSWQGTFCIMKLYARYYGDWMPSKQDYKYQSLTNAGRQCRINLPNTHRSLADTLLTRALLMHMASNP